MPITRGKEIHELFEAMAYNEVSTISVDQAITDLVKRHDIGQDKSVCPSNAEELAKRLLEISDMVEKDRTALNNIFSKRVPIAIETPAKDIDLLISFSRYYAALILQNKLWYHVNIARVIAMRVQLSELNLTLPHSFGPRVVLGGQSSIGTAMIVMADADLYSATRTLTTERVGKTDYLDRPLWYLKKIFVQEPAKEKFLELIDELQMKDDTGAIKSMLHPFRNKDEVLRDLEKEVYVKALTIWSSDIVTAKNMANLAERVFLVWINSYGEIGPGVSLPWAEVEHHNSVKTENRGTTLMRRTEGKKSVDLFYGGTWQEPMGGDYWKDDEILRASATWNDVEKCVSSGESGFKKWRSLPLSDRQKCFHRLANRIQSNGDSELSRSIRVWAQWPILYGSTSSRIQDGRVEILTTREPRGVIAIVSSVRIEMFRRLICACIAGNSVIIINGHGANTASGIEEYCDALTICGFPPGVINFLSFYDLPNAIAGLSKNRSIAVTCTDFVDPGSMNDLSVASNFWIDTKFSGDTTDEKLYAKFTRPKSVWLPLQ